MLRNGLGHLIQDEIKTSNRFIDLFCGSGVVAQFAATSGHPIKVCAYDLQLFCAVLADSVISRKTKLEPSNIWEDWHKGADHYLRAHRHHAGSLATLPAPSGFTQQFVEEMRNDCEKTAHFGLTSAYGGHYFSRAQALWLDALRATLPDDREKRSVALAALIQAASQCAASPGHTAQPFQPTRSAKQCLFEAWSREVKLDVQTAMKRLCAVHAQIRGGAEVKDANAAAADLRAGDIVFIDPPYSSVHYSRFYHVLETVANGDLEAVSGIGRYPHLTRRPRSKYSVKTESATALDELLKTVAENGARALLTFPDHACSNGLSGDMVGATAAQYFKVSRRPVANRFSTLGGTKDGAGVGYGRSARQSASELIFILTPR